MDGLFNSPLPGCDSSSQIAALNIVLYADISGIIFPINKRRTVAYANICNLAERNLLAGRITYQQVGNFALIAPVLRLHAHDQVKQLFTLNHLSDGLASHCRLHNCLNITHVDSITCAFSAVHIHQKTRLAEFTHHDEIAKARHLLQGPFHLNSLVLEHLQVWSIDFHCQGALQAGQRFIDRIFGGLSVVENNSRISLQLGVDRSEQLRLGVNPSGLPDRVAVRVQTHIELIVEKSCWISSVVWPSKL